jgi:hypothetical protein
MKRVLYAIAFLVLPALQPAAAQVIEHVDPPSWFTGMKEDVVQLMIYGKEIASFDVKTDYPGVEVKTMIRTENPNYLFVNLKISDEAVPGTVILTFTRGRQKLTHSYPLLARHAGPARGLAPSRFVLLTVPGNACSTVNVCASDDPSTPSTARKINTDRPRPGASDLCLIQTLWLAWRQPRRQNIRAQMSESFNPQFTDGCDLN